ncbi:MAG TPA: gluconate 2-dehydrogenase subunit 3 family protein [Saprospiraceae bacterium]|nr:gluconate 2-dehydrogenase subunit 3 family protein [Saprospiraceae bacterium]
MERRDVLKYTVLYLGLTLSSSTITAILAGCHVDNSEDWLPNFLTNDETEFINELAETILPATSTPGAKDAMVVRYIDTVRPLRYSDEDNQNFHKDLLAFMETSKKEMGKEFVKSSNDKKLEWVTAVDKDSYEALKTNKAEEKRPFYLSLKEQILSGYFDSEVVAKEYFNFDPVPASYEGCVPYEDIGRAWAI